MGSWGLRLGWWIGGLGSLAWLPILSVIWWVQGRAEGGVAGLAITALGIAYLVFMAPWRHPDTPIRRLYLGFLAVQLAGAGAAVWTWRDALRGEGPFPVFVVFTLLIPMMTLGPGTWRDLQGRGERDDRHGNLPTTRTGT